MDPRYIVGIDLGTTNSALAYLDSTIAEEEARVATLAIPQLVNPNEVAELSLLPSFLYVAGAMDFPKGSLALPWDENPRFVIGELARKRGAESPARLVSSAKSWLCYAEVDRTTPILPWRAPDEVPKLSPLEASIAYLEYLGKVWDARLWKSSGAPLREQDVFLTVPASFDEQARELTRHAAQKAGFEHVTLLEEPQAAFYSWIESQRDRWRRQVKVGDLVLVCDVGGGTTDFSLIAVSEKEGELTLDRIAVGDHILLGGDNMDLALARLLQQRIEAGGQRIDTLQLQSLWHLSRRAKETLFEKPNTQKQTVTILGKGSKLVGGALKAELTRDDLNQVLLEGFFPRTRSTEMPARQRRIGFQELGLPYAADAAITRHLARFLSQQTISVPEGSRIRRGSTGFACPTHVLFNGGVMKAEPLRSRLMEVLNGWLADEEFAPLTNKEILAAPDLDHAVARGAAYYGGARRGRGVRIRSGAARTHYIGIESAMPAVPGLEAPVKALCVVPFGMEEGTEAKIPDREFGLVVGEPAEFRFLSSRHSQAGCHWQSG